MSGKECEELRQHLEEMPLYDWEKKPQLDAREFENGQYAVWVRKTMYFPRQIAHVYHFCERHHFAWSVTGEEEGAVIMMQ